MLFKMLTSFSSKSFTLFFEIANIDRFITQPFLFLAIIFYCIKYDLSKTKKVVCNPVRDILKNVPRVGELQSPSTPALRRHKIFKINTVFDFKIILCYNNFVQKY